MEPTQCYTQLANLFKHVTEGVSLSGNDMRFSQYNFTSVFPAYPEGEGTEHEKTEPLEDVPDHLIDENLNFTYPVIYPAKEQKFDAAIILLHGLNERSWNKYLPWAYRLAGQLQRPVIMFPISFHMNRAPASWSNPRLMSALLSNTRLRNPCNHSSTFANVALSLRLSRKPERFFTSGCQSLNDLLALVNHLKSGNHPLMEKDSNIDFFAYSIGAFLAQVMMLAYGDSALHDSRVFIFCGGAPFNRMNGISKLILDEEASFILKFYYLKSFEKEIKGHSPLAEYIYNQPAGQAFRAMINAADFTRWREDRFNRMGCRIHAIGLAKDKVIPAKNIAEILAPERIEILDFPYDYTHENPFPLQADSEMVNQGFDVIFEKATAFFATKAQAMH